MHSIACVQYVLHSIACVQYVYAELLCSKNQSLSFVLSSLQRCCFYWNGLASARGNLSVILYTLRTTYTQRPWQKRLRSTAKSVGVSVFFGVVQSQDLKFTMPLYVFEALPLEAIQWEFHWKSPLRSSNHCAPGKDVHACRHHRPLCDCAR